MPAKSFVYGALAGAVLFGVYFSVLTFVSGWSYALDQFSAYWYFIVSLVLGFGIQVGLYTYLRGLVLGNHGSGKVLGMTGTTSTLAMISCCTHYLANLVPIIGISGIVVFVGKYQVPIFWFGLLSNLLGITYIGRRISKFKSKL